MRWCGKKDCSWNTTHNTSFHNPYKKTYNIYQPYTHPYIKSLNKSNEATPDVDPTSFTSGTFPTESTNITTDTNSSANNYVLYIKHSVALADLTELETQSMIPDIFELFNIFQPCLI